MSHPARDARLADELTRFETELRRLALSLVEQVFAEELARRLVETPTVVPVKPRRGRPPKAAKAAAPAVEAAVEAAAAPAPAVEAAAAPAPAARPGKRRVWTREMVLEELSTWLLSGTPVEAAFVTRYGQPGLVANAKRLFGRFDAALNAANLLVAQRQAEAPPSAAR